MTKSLNMQKPPKKSACDPKTRLCLRALQNDPCDYYQKVHYKDFSQCMYQRYIIKQKAYSCWNKQAWPKTDNDYTQSRGLPVLVNVAEALKQLTELLKLF
jgi:hypothetical protein